MTTELLAYFDEFGNRQGIETRQRVHEQGLWHETFHCWFVREEKGVQYLYFQKRSDEKADYPSLYDITAAGHILANETVQDGVREVREELGIQLMFNDLNSLGIIKDCLEAHQFTDREFCHVFLYQTCLSNDQFNLQQEEVSGVVRAELQEFEKLWFGELEKIRVEGFLENTHKVQRELEINVTKQDFVPHQDSYIKEVIKKIKGK
ncbi:NUDIX hydrolase [Metabacillus endolithicus]|uniref:NUDIX domain-containing protein n=1 Tax=Metabacillus endolithicus TaxID=1535204 RepID=A0ABW5BX78_9BACI